MKVIQQGRVYQVDTTSGDAFDITFCKLHKSKELGTRVQRDGITENELISVLVARLTHLYESTELPDFKAAVRKLKEANFLISPHIPSLHPEE